LRRDLLAGANGRPVALPFKATWSHLGFFAEPLTDNFDAAGRWSVTFTGDGGSRRTASRLPGRARDRDGSHGRVEHRAAGEVHGELAGHLTAGPAGCLSFAERARRTRRATRAWTGSARRVSWPPNPDAVLEDAPSSVPPRACGRDPVARAPVGLDWRCQLCDCARLVAFTHAQLRSSPSSTPMNSPMPSTRPAGRSASGSTLKARMRSLS
jgi:hypothetical protein